MSPLLFSIFVEDLELFLQKDNNSGLSIDDITIILLLFADDMAIIGKTPSEVQGHLENLHEYCNTWGLKVNTEKTKIMVFRKRGGLLRNEHWTYNSQPIHVVNDFNYLGVVFNSTGSFNLNQEHLTGKALKAMNVLLCKCKEYDFKPHILCQLFDAFVTSILNYSCEIWGYTKSRDIERIHLKFCKRLLNVRTSTCNATVYGELGRFPLYIHRYVRILKYWFKVIHSENIILKTVYNQALYDCQHGSRNWVFNIKSLLDEFGFTYVFDNYESVNSKIFLPTFKLRVTDTFKQNWRNTVDTSSLLDKYRYFKDTLSYETYLDIVPKSLISYFSRLRMSVLPLRIQTGRYERNNLTRNERYCQCCNSNDIEDEYHFICTCPYFETLRKYLDTKLFVRPSVFKYLDLLKSNDKVVLVKLCLYIKEALQNRINVLSIQR